MLVLTAVIAASASIAVALVTAFFNARQTKISRRDAALARAEAASTALKLAEYQASRTDESKARDARSDYEYEARKRLYAEVQPLVFQLTEAAEAALNRIKNLAIHSRRDDLRERTESREESTWLRDMDGYYATMLMYHTTLPMALFRLIQEKLTIVDLSVEPKLRTYYAVAKVLYGSWRDDHRLAAHHGAQLDYDPTSDDFMTARVTQPQAYWKQGIATGHLAIATAALIVREKDAVPRVVTYDEFAAAYANRDGALHQAFAPVAEMYREFRQPSRPVLWRVLVTQASLYRWLRDFATAGEEVPRVRLYSREEQLRQFDWRGPADKDVPEEAVTAPFDAAAHYLREFLGSSLVS